VASCFPVEGKQYHSGSFPIETMDGHQGFHCSLFSQSDQKRFMEKFPGGNHRQEMRFICNQDVFILIEHLLPKGYGFFIFQLAVIENASANSKGSLCIDAASGFIHHLTLRHPCLPSRGMHVRILFLEKVDDSFPWTWWKPLAARTNSCDERKRGVQINLIICYVPW
jgi:hypothetical protein